MTEKSATFSSCRKYRYTLWRHWGKLSTTKYVMFIGLNPSTADEINDDHTIRRCIRYAQDWGYRSLCMTNLFAFRATKPKNMKAAKNPIGIDNDHILVEIAKHAKVIVAAWGINGSYMNRDIKVRKILQQLHYLKLTKNGFPAHPLFLPKGLTPVLWK